jgi:hypothetical protein
MVIIDAISNMLLVVSDTIGRYLTALAEIMWEAGLFKSIGLIVITILICSAISENWPNRKPK